MSKLTIPTGYKMPLTNNELQRAIELIHEDFQRSLTLRLNLHRVSAPLFVDGRTGLNDDLNGVERPVSFDIPDVGAEGQVVHSLAKWKRLALKRYEFPQGMGLFTDMNAIRRDEVVDNLHSIYVDQWDWEKHIGQKDRSLQYLKDTVRDIVGERAGPQHRQWDFGGEAALSAPPDWALRGLRGPAGTPGYFSLAGKVTKRALKGQGPLRIPNFLFICPLL